MLLDVSEVLERQNRKAAKGNRVAADPGKMSLCVLGSFFFFSRTFKVILFYLFYTFS